jgi:hypothetical protein
MQIEKSLATRRIDSTEWGRDTHKTGIYTCMHGVAKALANSHTLCTEIKLQQAVLCALQS